jgi:hypothetical protein
MRGLLICLSSIWAIVFRVEFVLLVEVAAFFQTLFSRVSLLSSDLV